MPEKLHDTASRLQAQIFEHIDKKYKSTAIRYWFNPPHIGEMEKPDGHARLKGKCGDTIEIFLRFEEERVKEALFTTDGCRSSHACASMAAELALGKIPDQLLEITGDAIIEELGSLPENDQHCAFLAAETLQEALNNYMINKTKNDHVNG